MLVKSIRILYYVLRELVFDNKEEYDFSSSKFNTRKFIVTVMMMVSLTLNGWLLYLLVDVGMKHVALVNTCARQEEEKKPLSDPSDR